MPEQSRFENVDLFASLEAIMKQNTGFYQSDLEIDKEIIAKAAASPRKEAQGGHNAKYNKGRTRCNGWRQCTRRGSKGSTMMRLLDRALMP